MASTLQKWREILQRQHVALIKNGHTLSTLEQRIALIESFHPTACFCQCAAGYILGDPPECSSGEHYNKSNNNNYLWQNKHPAHLHN